MNPIYCIIEDDNYDFCSVIGYVGSEEDAQQLCIQHNDAMTNNDRRWFYEAADKMAPPTKRCKLAYMHEVVFDRVSKRPLKYQMRVEPGRFTYFRKYGKLPEAAISQNNAGIVMVTVSMCQNDRQRAENKAKTMLVKFLLSGELAGEKGSVQKWTKDLLL